MRPAARFRQAAWSLLRDDAGNATVEFVLITPALFYVLFTIGELGIIMTRSAMLDRGISVAVRDLRLGLTPGVTHDQIKERICDAAFLLGSCEDVLMLELVPLPDAASFPPGQVACVDRSSDIAPVTTFNPGARSEIMLVRACLVADPLFPGVGLGAMLPKDASGGYAILAQSAFMNEPE
jgi:hypothetical protein